MSHSSDLSLDWCEIRHIKPPYAIMLHQFNPSYVIFRSRYMIKSPKKSASWNIKASSNGWTPQSGFLWRSNSHVRWPSQTQLGSRHQFFSSALHRGAGSLPFFEAEPCISISSSLARPWKSKSNSIYYSTRTFPLQVCVFWPDLCASRFSASNVEDFKRLPWCPVLPG